LVDEHGSGLPVESERFAGSAGTVERSHQQGVETLAEAMLSNKSLQLRHDLNFAGAAKIGFEAVLQSTETKFLEPLSLAPQRLRWEAGQRRAAPERKRRAQQLARLLVMTHGKCAVPLLDAVLEFLQVELAAVEFQPVTAGASLDRITGQLVAEARDVGLDGPSGSLWRLVPEIVDEPLERDRLPCPEQERREHTLLHRPAEGEL